MYLKQSTSSQEILLGRFLDSTDGDTEVTGLTIANTDIKLHKSGATTLASKNSGGGTHISNGLYYAVLDATDTDTLGNLEVHVHVATALAVKREYTVLPAVIYDAIIGGGVIPDSVATAGSRPTVLQALLMLTRVFLTRRRANGLDLEFYKEDGTTISVTSAMDNATAPTNIARTS